MSARVHSPGRKFRLVFRIFLCLMAILLILSTSGCGLYNSIKDFFGSAESSMERALNVVDHGIAQLQNESEDWQNVLTDMQAQLTEDAQSTIREEITTLMQRSTEAVTTDVKCIIDMTRTRVIQDLVRIRSEILGNTPPAKEPYICNAIPSVVDMAADPANRNRIELYGFDFDTTPPIQVILVDSAGTKDVSQFLDRPTHYLMTLNLGGSGIPVNPESQKIVLRWNGIEESTISVVQPITPVCITKPNQEFTPPSITLVPPRTRGDAEFDGNGPNVFVSANLKQSSRAINVSITMHATETKSDWTTASGQLNQDLIIAPPGWAIASLDSPPDASINYIDTDHEADNFNGGGPVSQFIVVGDTSGDDAGRSTKVDVVFNTIQYTLIQIADCVDPNSLVQGIEYDAVSVYTMKRLADQVPNDYWKMIPLETWKTMDSDLLDAIPKAKFPINIRPIIAP